MAKTIDLNDLLEESAVTIKVNGKDYTVRDLPLDLTKDSDGDNGIKSIVMRALKCEEADLEGLGIAALAKIMDVLYENLLPSHNSEK